jgi:futalosine hydrolase
VVTAVDAEREAVSAAFPGLRPVPVGPYEAWGNGEVTVLAGGVGPAAAAAATASALAAVPVDLAVSAGIGGGFAGAARPGDVVEATVLVAADLGADSPAGFRSLAELGFGSCELAATPLGLPGSVRGPVLTVSSATGTDERAAELAARHGAAAEAMEGWGVAEAARRRGLPVAELRTISNVVGRRDRASWDIPAALAALRGAALAFRKGLDA